MSSPKPFKCFTCNKDVYLQKDAQGKNQKYDDTSFKIPHRDPEKARPPRKLSFWTGLSWEVYQNENSDLKKTYTMSKESLEGTDPQKSFDEVEAQILEKIRRDLGNPIQGKGER